MHIHFVCSGNTNRSRLAEAYLNSKKIKDLQASSSGIFADKDKNSNITFFAKKILKTAGILSFTSKSWQKTTKRILRSVDLVVFMKRLHFDYVKNELGFVPKNYYIWNIEDVPDNLTGDKLKIKQLKLALDEEIFIYIKKAVDKLLKDLRLI
jgi:protein-tyrosine-phosphatase